uniref:non-specific serine/threonine protein kinase n=1 Tax=Pygocentrus nattereri TaxID=42514 RepID=A0AAR2JN69_PYGNA
WALDRAAHCVRQNIISFNTPLQKEIDRFKRLLRDSETVKELDRTSACRASRSNTLTWDAVFRFLKKYLHKETELLQSGKANVSATTQANRRKKMQEISSLIKYFVRCANKRGPKLKCADLLGHVVEVMQSSFSCAAYGEDYSSMLLKNILSVRKYWCEISQHQWHNLLELYCGLFTGTSRPINRVLVSRIIHTVVQGCCLQTEGLSHTLFSFFSKALSNTREERQLTVLEHLISALNVFLRSVAMNCRRRVCRLGEELLPSVLYVWSQKRPSSTLKEEMVEFFNLQLCVHHPKGAKTLETGAHAEDWVKWQSLLCNLYDVLVDEISHIGSRGKYATGSRHIAVKENLIELTADICHQLFSQDVRVVEVRGAQRDSPQSSKRRRVELGWEVLRDHLQPHHSDFDVIPWLQVTAALTSKYPSMLPAPELLPLLSLLCQLLGEQQRRGERGPYVLRCLRQVALCPAACSQGSGAQQCELGRLWSKVWAMAIRGVSSAQTEALCLELLRTMVQCSLVPVDREFWKLFSSAISFLSAFCRPQSSVTPPVCMVRCLRLLTGVLGAFVCIGLFTAEDACHCALFQKAKVDHAKGVIFNPLSQDLLTNQDLAFLSTLEFLSLCVSFDMGHGLAFKPTEIRRRLLKLLEQIDCSKPLVIVFFVCLHRDVCSLYRQDQEVCSSILLALLPCVRCLGRVRCSDEEADEMNHVRGALLRVVSGFRCATKKVVRAPPAVCADPCCKWAVLSLREEELPVCAVLPSHLADPHHHVRMLTAMTNRERKKMLPLKHQQTAFENVYLKAQEGMKIQVTSHSSAPEDLPDETFNRRATLLKSLSVVMCCSPVCEKQALFALLQSYNSIEEQLIKKVLGGVSRSLGYRSSKAFVWSHLYYLVAEWLGQREKDSSYTLQSFPYTLLNYSTLEEFYRLSYHVLIPHLVFLNDFEQVKSIGSHLKEDWRKLLANCFPKIMVNILPHFALPGQDAHEAQQREKAYRVYDLLKDSDCLGKQQIDSLIWGNLAEIVVELLMTLYEGAGAVTQCRVLVCRELDPAPNPPFFSSSVIRDTLDHLSKCHSATHKSLVAILSKTPMSMQKILASICQRAAETTNAYERHRILMMYHLFVNLLLREVKDGLGGSWAFVLRDVIYTLIHHINSRSAHTDEVSTRSLALCCDLLTTVCQTAIHFCDDALETHLQVIVGTLTALVTQQSAISQQVLRLLKFLVIDNPDNRYLRRAIPLLEPFPDQPAFRELRAAQHALKYSSGAFSLRQEVEHFLSVTSCDSLPLTRLEGLKDLKRQLHTLKQQIEQLLKESDPAGSVLVKLVLNLLQLCKLAANHPGGRDILEAVGGCLGVLGPVDLSTIALHHGKDQIYSQAAALCPDALSQWIFIILSCMNNALTHHSISVRQAAAVCLKDVLATQSGLDFWEMYKSQGDPMLLYLSPFRSTVKSEVAPASRDRLDSVDLWLVQPGRHKDWLRNLCIALLDSGGVQNEALLMTRPLCEVKTDFCQKVLPLFIHDVLLGDRSGSWRELLSTHIQDFFSSCSRPAKPSSRPTTPTSPDSEADANGQSQPDKCSLRTMLAVINYLRQQGRPAEYGTVCESNFWLDLNYLEVALAAQLCSAHFTALLYSEIYVDNIRTNMEEKRRYLWSLCKLGRTSSRPLEFETPALRSDLLIEVYRSIGEPDSLYGCGGGKLINPLTRIRTYEHEAMWGKALASYDLHTNLPEVTRQVGIVEGLQNLGLCSILSTYLAGLEREVAEWSPELRELRFQAAWRMKFSCKKINKRHEKLNLGFNESIFTSLQALKDKDFTMFGQTLKYARGSGVDELCRGSLEAVSSLYPALCSLQMIEELQSVRPLFSGPVSDSDLVEVYSKWHQHLDLLTDSDFSLVEPILALRSSIQETLLTCEADPGRKTYLSSAYSSHLMELCRLARSAGNTQLAERAVFQMKQHSGVSSGSVSSWAWQLEEAQVFWVKKEQGLALGLLRQMIDKLQDLVMYAECLRLCGSWLSETCLESPAVILDSYLERAVEVIVGHGGAPDPKLQSQKTQAFLSLARFSDAQYQGIENYMRSSEFENKQALLEKAKEEVDLMKERKVTNNRYTVKVQRELELDVRAMSNLQADRRRFLLKAVENYIRCLELGEEHDTWVFRLASLWLENADVRNVNDMMKEGVKNIPSYKFLPLMYQLAARMGTKVSNPVTSEDVGFHTVLTELICQACMDHPHHTLFIILALVNANKDESFSRIRLSKSSARQPSPLDLERAEVALKIMNEIRKRKAQMIRGIETLCSAYITLAYMDASRHKTEKKAIPIPVDQPIMQIKDLDDVIIPTMEIKVDPSGRYEDLVTISSFKPHFHLAGGVNLPKIIDCVGSDGKSRRQLVKGQDDLRQDAVMQQVFHMCSMLLQRNTETRKRKLNIRRYKVVPFSQRSGVLEWCSGTVPIGEFLVDPQKGAHKRFRPQDWTNLSCRKKMMDAQRMGFDAKLQAFTEVCQNFRPVFRYFCMERFLDPAVWMEKRLAYTRSVATSSIVGYIVGLGDRHIQNILIDEQTAELVHIDLGVAFEQGKILPTPETVPFRLSRDIVDGMGITGVEGVFRRCCEKTMEVMRSSQEVLLTIVEVLLYDPLFDWTMNPLKAFYLQQQQDEQAELNATLNPTPAGEEPEAHRKASSDSQSFNKVAERVLLRLQEKLKGVEEGAVLSVGGQVNLLIQQAMDSENLSRLFPGWQAWV